MSHFVCITHITLKQVTVFDFPIILETTEKRVGNDLLGAGPKTVEELREMHAKLVVKYQKALEEKERKAGSPSKPPPNPEEEVAQVMEMAGNAALDVFNKFKAASPPFLRRTSNDADAAKNNDVNDKKSSRPTDVVTEEVDFQQPATTPVAAPDLLTANSPEKSTAEEAGWANITTDSTTGEVTTAVGEFCIDDDEDDDAL